MAKKCVPLENLSSKDIKPQTAKTALRGQNSGPAEPLSLKFVQKWLNIKALAKKNCAPFKIRIVSKLVCSYVSSDLF